jgi:hypothetical protein
VSAENAGSPDHAGRPTPLERAYGALLDDEDHGYGDLPDEVAAAVPGNAAKQIVALTLQKAGDLVVDAKTVLAWLLIAVGAPAAFTGLLVPIRESGSMLPQVLLVPVVRRLAVRKWVWVLGGGLQALSVLAMAAVAATLTGTSAGVGILLALTAFAFARSLSSIASKDVLGRTVPKGARGQINGYATVGAGVAAITVGLGLRAVGGEDTPPETFAWLLVGAAVAWVLAVVSYAAVTEAPGERDHGGGAPIGGAVRLLRDDAPFRRFVVARTLLLVSALTPPFVVTLASREGESGLAGLGAFVISSGIASLLGGRFWGRLADRSSRRTMMIASGAASTVVIVFLGLLLVDEVRGSALLYPATYLLLALAHTGARLGRKTYVVDLAEGNKRTDYVAVSNTAMGILLLLTGVLTSAVAVFGVEAALLVLAVLGYAGVVVSGALPEVSDASG